MDSGGQCATTTGTSEMPTWSADNWTVALSFQHHKVQLLDRALGPSGWTTSTVAAPRRL